MNKVLITDPVSDNGIKILKNKNIEVFYHPNDNLDELKNIIKQVDGWIIRSGTKIDKKQIQANL